MKYKLTVFPKDGVWRAAFFPTVDTAMVFFYLLCSNEKLDGVNLIEIATGKIIDQRGICNA